MATTATDELDADIPTDEAETAAEADEASVEGAANDEAGDEKPEGEDAEASAEEGADDDEIVVTIGDETPPEEEAEPAKPWVNELRKNYRQTVRRVRELEAELQRAKGSTQQAAEVVVGEEPTLPEFAEAEQIATFKREWAAWNERKAQAERLKQQREAEAAKAQEAWNATRQTYEKAKADLAAKMPRFEEAEDAVREALSPVQQGLLLDGLEKPAVVVAALGLNPKLLKEVAAITSPAKFVAKLAKLEDKVKVQPRKAPPPERKIGSTGAGSAASVAHLQRLEAEADRTGDRTKVAAYKRQQLLKQRAA